MNQIAALILSLALLTGCDTATKTYENHPDDLAENKEYMEAMYQKLSDGRSQDVADQFGPDLSSNNARELLDKLNVMHGSLVRSEIVNATTHKEVTGENVQKVYRTEMIVEYERTKCSEYITLRSFNDTLLITGYDSQVVIESAQ
jgi:hypothetical protein